MRSCTVETIYTAAGYQAKSAGTEWSANVPLSNELISWADLIFAMEEKHKVIINSVYADIAANKRIIVLNIPDNYFYMDDDLVVLIKERVGPYVNL